MSRDCLFPSTPLLSMYLSTHTRKTNFSQLNSCHSLLFLASLFTTWYDTISTVSWIFLMNLYLGHPLSLLPPSFIRFKKTCCIKCPIFGTSKFAFYLQHYIRNASSLSFCFCFIYTFDVRIINRCTNPIISMREAWPFKLVHNCTNTAGWWQNRQG